MHPKKCFTDYELNNISHPFDVGCDEYGEIYVGELHKYGNVMTAHFCGCYGKGDDYYIPVDDAGKRNDIRKIFEKYYEIRSAALVFLKKYKDDHENDSEDVFDKYYSDVIIKAENRYIAKFCEAKNIGDIEALNIDFLKEVNSLSNSEA